MHLVVIACSLLFLTSEFKVLRCINVVWKSIVLNTALPGEDTVFDSQLKCYKEFIVVTSFGAGNHRASFKGIVYSRLWEIASCALKLILQTSLAIIGSKNMFLHRNLLRSCFLDVRLLRNYIASPKNVYIFSNLSERNWQQRHFDRSLNNVSHVSSRSHKNVCTCTCGTVFFFFFFLQ